MKPNRFRCEWHPARCKWTKGTPTTWPNSDTRRVCKACVRRAEKKGGGR